MTTVYITNSENTWQSTKYYIEIYAGKIETDCTTQIQTELLKPKGKSKWGSESLTYFIDLQKRVKAITITGHIDKYSNRTSVWAASAVHDAGVVKLRIEAMWDLGGPIRVYAGTASDGYYDVANSGTDNYIIDGMITKIKFIEGGDDHIDRTSDSESYPSSSKALVDKYEIIMSVTKGTIR